MADQSNRRVKTNQESEKLSETDKQPENQMREFAGLPDINAGNFDDQGDIEGIQLGMATHGDAHSANTDEQHLPSEREKIKGGKSKQAD